MERCVRMSDGIMVQLWDANNEHEMDKNLPEHAALNESQERRTTSNDYIMHIW